MHVTFDLDIDELFETRHCLFASLIYAIDFNLTYINQMWQAALL